MQKSLLILVLILSVCGWSQSHPTVSAAQTSQHFDGKWWSKTSSEEHSGFINGAADCLTWTAHKKGFNATPEQLVDKITKFYEEHPDHTTLASLISGKNCGPRLSQVPLPRNRVRRGKMPTGI